MIILEYVIVGRQNLRPIVKTQPASDIINEIIVQAEYILK